MEAQTKQNLANAQQLIAALTYQAHRDVDVVIGFLRDFGVQRQLPDGKFENVALPPEQLLGIALAIRLRSWEINGISPYLDAELPRSDAVLNQVIYDPPGPELSTFVTQTNLKTQNLYAKHFLWSAHDCDLGADLAIVAEIDEDFLDAIADFLLSIDTEI